MKRVILSLIFLLSMFFLWGCGTQYAYNNDGEMITGEDIMLVMTINGAAIDVTWEDNKAIKEIKSYIKENPIVINTHAYGGFEQVGALPQSFSSDDKYITTEPGDIVLYNRNQMVVFFDSNSWSYTKLGKINLPQSEVSKILDVSSTTIELRAN